MFFFQAEDGIRDATVTGVQTCALPISPCARDDCAIPRSMGAHRREAAGTAGVAGNAQRRVARDPADAARTRAARAGSRACRLQALATQADRADRPLSRRAGAAAGRYA